MYINKRGTCTTKSRHTRLVSIKSTLHSFRSIIINQSIRKSICAALFSTLQMHIIYARAVGSKYEPDEQAMTLMPAPMINKTPRSIIQVARKAENHGTRRY